MKHSDSLKLLNNAVSPAKVLVSVTSNSISHVMRTTRGKEKLLALIQYASELFKLTTRDYLHTNNSQENPIHLQNAIEIEKSMRNGRKLMRVLMFVDEINIIEKVWKSHEKFDCFKVIRILNHFSSMVFYLLDNLVWCADIGIINKYVTKANLEWRTTKDMACLAKCILQSLLSVFTAYQSHIRIKLAESLIRSKQETVQKDGKLSLIIDDLLSTRKEYRIHKLNVIVSILRYLMLTKALNLPGAQHMSRIFVSICGILSMSFMVFTLLLGNSVVKIESPKTEKNNLIN